MKLDRLLPEKPRIGFWMKSLLCKRIRTLAAACVVMALGWGANAAELSVYKGVLVIGVQATQGGDALLIRYRSKTREVVRIGVEGLVLTGIASRQGIRPGVRTAVAASSVDGHGYWSTNIVYEGLELGDDHYRVEGRLMLYLIDSQRSEYFRVYLKPGKAGRPPGSGIDWGADERYRENGTAVVTSP